MYKAFLVDKKLLDADPHFQQGCAECHKGDEKAPGKDGAHAGMVKRPSDNPAVCESCHEAIAKGYKASLHYTTAGLRHGVSARFSPAELQQFGAQVFGKACQSCHASCGDCHVKSPVIGGVNVGLLKGHKFVKRDEGKTCALCHGGRVYPEFTGDYGGTPDVHYQKGMSCMDCHKVNSFHGTSGAMASRKAVPDRPACVTCHKPGQEKTEQAKSSHVQHSATVSCTACHSAAPYRNCYDCHLGKGATAKPAFILGLSPRDKKTVTTLRVIPTIRDTFKSAGIAMANFDALPNYWDTTPHNIRKRTERTRSCEVCHGEQKDFLTKETLIKNGSRANDALTYSPKPLKK